MRLKAIGDLADRPDDDFFEEIATGLELIARNALAMEEDARVLWEQKRGRGHAVLRSLAAEEAGKFLILLDAVRCPRDPREVVRRHLSRFHDHVAKGIYARYCDFQPATLADAARMVAHYRLNFYLDGPNDVDWIFPNAISFDRESAFYVDYIEADEGHGWHEPWRHNVLLESGFRYHAPRAIRLVGGLHAVGVANVEALRVIADTWRTVTLTPDFHRHDLRVLNIQTLERLQPRATDAPAAACSVIEDGWLFPLHGVDLSRIKVDPDALRAYREDYWYRQMGV